MCIDLSQLHKLEMKSVTYLVHDVKKRFLRFFIIFIKKRVFLFFERFLFSSGALFYPTKPVKIVLNLQSSCIKRLLSDGLGYTKILPCRAVALMHINTVNFTVNFSFGLINFINLLTTFFIVLNFFK